MAKSTETKAKAEAETKDSQTNQEKNTTPSREELFRNAIAGIRKAHGEGAVMQFSLGEDGEEASSSITKVQVIPSNILAVDRVTKVGGIPRGRITEVLGPESSGKTTLCLHVVESAISAGGSALYVDMEHALEGSHLRNIGIKHLEISQPDSAESALDIVEMAVKSGAVDVVVVDSVSALVPKAELDGEMGDSHVGLQARLMSQAMRKLTGIVAKSNSVVIFINQIRYKIGVKFGSPETTSGGNALKFYASLRLDMRRIGTETSGSDAYANKVKVKAIKNKVAPPFAQEEFTMFYDASKTIASGAVDLGSKLGVVTKSGSWYSYNEEKLGQGLFNSTEFLINNPEMLNEILSVCRTPEVLNRKLAATSSDDVM